jgi:hypothetical protein
VRECAHRQRESLGRTFGCVSNGTVVPRVACLKVASWQRCSRLLISLLLVAATGIGVHSTVTAADDASKQAIRVFLEALRLQGRNPTQIRSGDIRYRERVRSADQDRSSKAGLIAKLEKLAAESPSDIGREQWKDEIRRIQNEEAAGPQAMQPAKMWIKRDVFEGNNPRKRSRQESRLEEAANGLTSEQVLLADHTGRDTANLVRFGEAHATSLYIDQFALSPIEQLGRARSPMALALTTLFLANGGNHETFTFSPDTLSSFEGGRVYDLEFGRRESVKEAGMPTRCLRMSVDPDRGHIVPLEEEWHDGKLVLRLESSDYEAVRSTGLWFPMRSKETRFDPATGGIVAERVWMVSEVSLNDPVDPLLFEVTIPPGEDINDFRGGAVTTTYRTEAAVTLGARVQARDLTSIPGVAKTSMAAGRFLPVPANGAGFRRIALIGTVVVVALLLLAVVRRRRM